MRDSLRFTISTALLRQVTNEKSYGMHFQDEPEGEEKQARWESSEQLCHGSAQQMERPCCSRSQEPCGKMLSAHNELIHRNLSMQLQFHVAALHTHIQISSQNNKACLTH